MFKFYERVLLFSMDSKYPIVTETETHWIVAVKDPDDFEPIIAVPCNEREISYLRARRKNSQRIGVVILALNKKYFSHETALKTTWKFMSKGNSIPESMHALLIGDTTLPVYDDIIRNEFELHLVCLC